MFVLFVVYAARVSIRDTRAAHSAQSIDRADFPSLFSRPSSSSRIPERHSGDAGANPADRTISHIHTRRAPARAAWSPKPRSLGAAPRRRATLIQLRGRQVERQRPHKPFIRGFDSRPRYQFWAARSFRRSPASQAGEHGAKPWRSTIFNTTTKGLTCQHRQAPKHFLGW